MDNPLITFPTLDDLAAGQASVDAAATDQGNAALIDPLMAGIPPQISFLTKGVQPPTNLYFSVNDKIKLVVWAAVQTTHVLLTGRFLSPDGLIHELGWDFFVTTTVIPNSFVLNVAEGFLLDATLTTDTAATPRGQCFARLSILRGTGAGLNHHGVLLQDYITTGQFLQFPGGIARQSVEGPGTIVSHVVANPAAGADWSFSTPAQRRVKLRAIHAALGTSATVANRTPLLVIKDNSGNTMVVVDTASAEVASTNFGYTWMCGGVKTAPVSNTYNLPLPEDLALSQNSSIGTSTVSIQAGDQWSGIVVVTEEWWEPNAIG